MHEASQSPNVIEMRQRALKRANRLFRGFGILIGFLSALILLLFLGGLFRREIFSIGYEFRRFINLISIPLILLGVVFTFRLLQQNLVVRGVLVPAKRLPLQEGNIEETFHQFFGFVSHLAFIGIKKIIPLEMIHYEIYYQDKTIKLFNFIYLNEKLVLSEPDIGWALIDPRFPRLCRWFLTQEENG